MTSDTIGLLAAVLFLLIAVVGGGFTVKELTIPKVPNAGRVLAGLLGVLFAVPFVLSQAGADGQAGAASRVQLSAAQPSHGPQHGDEAVLWVDDQPDVTRDSIQLLGLEATSPRADVAVGDRVTVTFSLKNVAQAPRELAYTFVGARDPADEWSDFGEGNRSRVLRPGETVSVRTSIIPDEPGTWKLWPCYTIQREDGEHFCPDEWRAFTIPVNG
jgi:hypothetical protein